MGPAPTKQPTQLEEDNASNPKINHPRFQNATFSKSKNQEDIITIKLPLANEKQYTQWVHGLKGAPFNSQVGLFPRSHTFKKEGYCGSSGFVQIEYDNFPFILLDEITNRQTLKQKFFQEPELWYLVYTLLGAGKEFHQQSRKVGDIKPQNIFINEDGQVKVANTCTWPSEQSNYDKTFYQKQTTYLAPQQLRQIQFAKVEPSTDPVLAESFSVGLTCLDAGTLTNSKSLYLKHNKFDYKTLQARLGSLREIGYSDLMIMVIENLCQVDHLKRITCGELFDWLNPYEEAIINLNEFQPDRLPEKLVKSKQTYISPSMNQSQQVQYEQFNMQTLNQPVHNISPQKVETATLNQRVTYQQPVSITTEPETKIQSYYQPQQVTTHTFISNQGQVPKIDPENEYKPRASQNPIKSKLEIDLDKIDEQLQMSRKMFPS